MAVKGERDERVQQNGTHPRLDDSNRAVLYSNEKHQAKENRLETTRGQTGDCNYLTKKGWRTAENYSREVCATGPEIQSEQRREKRTRRTGEKVKENHWLGKQADQLFVWREKPLD